MWYGSFRAYNFRTLNRYGLMDFTFVLSKIIFDSKEEIEINMFVYKHSILRFRAEFFFSLFGAFFCLNRGSNQCSKQSTSESNAAAKKTHKQLSILLHELCVPILWSIDEMPKLKSVFIWLRLKSGEKKKKKKSCCHVTHENQYLPLSHTYRNKKRNEGGKLFKNTLSISFWNFELHFFFVLPRNSYSIYYSHRNCTFMKRKINKFQEKKVFFIFL